MRGRKIQAFSTGGSARKSKSNSSLMSIDGQALIIEKEIMDKILSILSNLCGIKSSYPFICDGLNWKALSLQASSSFEAPHRLGMLFLR